MPTPANRRDWFRSRIYSALEANASGISREYVYLPESTAAHTYPYAFVACGEEKPADTGEYGDDLGVCQWMIVLHVQVKTDSARSGLLDAEINERIEQVETALRALRFTNDQSVTINNKTITLQDVRHEQTTPGVDDAQGTGVVVFRGSILYTQT